MVAGTWTDLERSRMQKFRCDVETLHACLQGPHTAHTGASMRVCVYIYIDVYVCVCNVVRLP